MNTARLTIIPPIAGAFAMSGFLLLAIALVSPLKVVSQNTTTPANVLAEKWGVELLPLRLTAHDHMLDFRYRVLDADKAAALFVRKIKPRLIHQPSNKVLSVPDTAKIGPLRNSNKPQAGRNYWMFFGNAGGLVKRGDPVTITIGDFRAENLIVE